MFENNIMCLNEIRKNLAGDQSTLFAIFPPDLNHRDVMYASNAGAFTCPPFIQHAGGSGD